MVIYGDWKEIDAFLVVSDRNAYLYRITAPERWGCGLTHCMKFQGCMYVDVFMVISYCSIQPQNWLELMTMLPLKDIVYIDIGVGYQVNRSPLTVHTPLVG